MDPSKDKTSIAAQLKRRAWLSPDEWGEMHASWLVVQGTLSKNASFDEKKKALMGFIVEYCRGKLHGEPGYRTVHDKFREIEEGMQKEAAADGASSAANGVPIAQAAAAMIVVNSRKSASRSRNVSDVSPPLASNSARAHHSQQANNHLVAGYQHPPYGYPLNPRYPWHPPHPRIRNQAPFAAAAQGTLIDVSDDEDAGNKNTRRRHAQRKTGDRANETSANNNNIESALGVSQDDSNTGRDNEENNTNNAKNNNNNNNNSAGRVTINHCDTTPNANSTHNKKIAPTPNAASKEIDYNKLLLVERERTRQEAERSRQEAERSRQEAERTKQLELQLESEKERTKQLELKLKIEMLLQAKNSKSDNRSDAPTEANSASNEHDATGTTTSPMACSDTTGTVAESGSTDSTKRPPATVKDSKRKNEMPAVGNALDPVEPAPNYETTTHCPVEGAENAPKMPAHFNFHVEARGAEARHMHQSQNGKATAVCEQHKNDQKSEEAMAAGRPTLDMEPDERNRVASRKREIIQHAKSRPNKKTRFQAPNDHSGDHRFPRGTSLPPSGGMSIAAKEANVDNSATNPLAASEAPSALSATDADVSNVASRPHVVTKAQSVYRSSRISLRCGDCNKALPEQGHSSFPLLISSSLKHHHAPTNYQKHALCTACYKQYEKKGWLTNDRHPRLGKPWLDSENYSLFSFIHQYFFHDASMQEWDMCREMRPKRTYKLWTGDFASNMVAAAAASSPSTDSSETIQPTALPETTLTMGHHDRPHRQTIQELAAEGVKRVPYDVDEVDMDYPVLFEGSYEHFCQFGQHISSVHEAIMNIIQHGDPIEIYQELIPELRSPECFCTECIKDPTEKKVHGYLAKVAKNFFLNKHQDKSICIPRSLRLKNMTNLAMMFLNIDSYICQCHYDCDTSILTVVTGSKTVYLRRDKGDIPEDAERRLKINPSKMTDEDRLEQGWMKVVVNAGESLLIPKFWAHQVESAPHTSALGLCVASASI